MPKKFATENTKSVAARERKKAAKDAEVTRKKQAEDDAYWQDDHKQVMKKQQKKDELERKKQEALQKKAEVKALLEKETASIAKNTTKPAPPPKVTRAQINANKIVQQPKVEKEEKKVETHLDTPLIENINRLTIEGDEARSVTEAIAILSNNPDEIDKHPEKRMKAAYTAYEERRLKELKEESPSLKLSQLKQRIFKEWQKSPENPLNKVA